MTIRRQLPRFVFVGAAAALVHWSTATLLMFVSVAPLVANVGGFLIAFCVSYTGQRYLTFKAADIPHRRALPRYFLVSASSFAANEALFYLLLTYTPIPPQIALAIVLVLVAAGTFVMSRRWAFARQG